MTRITTLFILPLALMLGACDREDTDNAEPNDGAVADGEGGRGHHGRGGLKKLDTDKDGTISLAEAQGTPLADKFAEIDADKDGKLTRDELHAMKKGRHGEGDRGWHGKDPAERAARFIAKFDADKDGALTAAELADHPHMAEKFAEVDADKDGKLSVAELTAFKASHPGRGHGRGHGKGHDKGRGHGHDGDQDEARG
jgi:hypothetical protein